MLKLTTNSKDLPVQPTFDGPYQLIKQLDPDTEHIALGYFIAPTENNTITIEKLNDMVTHWSVKIQTFNLSNKNIILSYESVLRLKL